MGRHFGFPDRLWPLLQRSWEHSRGDIVSGRFDWAVTEGGLKVYEYNADSASCFLECGVVQVCLGGVVRVCLGGVVLSGVRGRAGVPWRGGPSVLWFAA